jgi:RNA polymerase sigma factor (TIGR02999 family)
MTTSETTSPEFSAALAACRNQESGALDRLATLLYPDLRRLARSQLRRLRRGQTLDTTGLVHETYLKLVGFDQFEDRRHFLAASARAMRFVLVDATRRRLADKRGGGRAVETLDEETSRIEDARLTELVTVADTLISLRSLDERLGDVVDCLFYAGYTEDETSDALGISPRTVRRDWQRARAWLKRELGHTESVGGGL